MVYNGTKERRYPIDIKLNADIEMGDANSGEQIPFGGTPRMEGYLNLPDNSRYLVNIYPTEINQYAKQGKSKMSFRIGIMDVLYSETE